jgi:hypothetical protein
MSYRTDRDHADHFRYHRDEATDDALREWNLQQRAHRERRDFSAGYSALVTALRHAQEACPDFLKQLPVDECAALILSKWPPSSGVSY